MLLTSVSNVALTMVPDITNMALPYCAWGLSMAKCIPGTLGRMSFGPRWAPACENQFPNRVCQRGALLCETVLCDVMTSGFVSDLFTVRLYDKGQIMLVICLQFTLSKKAKQSILTRSNVFLKLFTSQGRICLLKLHFCGHFFCKWPIAVLVVIPQSAPSLSPHNAPSLSPHNAPSLSPHNVPSLSPHNAPTTAAIFIVICILCKSDLFQCFIFIMLIIR